LHSNLSTSFSVVVVAREGKKGKIEAGDFLRFSLLDKSNYSFIRCVEQSEYGKEREWEEKEDFVPGEVSTRSLSHPDFSPCPAQLAETAL